MYKIAFYCDFDKRVLNDIFINNYPLTNEYVRFANCCLGVGYEVHSLDVYKKNNINPDLCIFLDIPNRNIGNIINKNMTKSLAMLREPELVNSLNYSKQRHLEFDAILTWKSSLVDNKKYFFFPSTRFVKNTIHVNSHFDRKLCVLIGSNLASNTKGELYSHRLKLIKWFEKNHKHDFDLYGNGWNHISFRMGQKILFKIKSPFAIRPSCMGFVYDKIKAMSGYKFAICFENSNNIDDYITEKIFDCFLSQVVPIYWGAPNVDTIIPRGCFLDFRDFKSYDLMYKYIKNMSYQDYMSYIEEINTYMDSKLSSKFYLENWVKFLLKAVERIKGGLI